jgi:hypothetical protein
VLQNVRVDVRIEWNEAPGGARSGAPCWSIATWWQFEQATVAKSWPLRAVSDELTIWAEAGRAIKTIESAASAATAPVVARPLGWDEWVMVGPWARSLRKSGSRIQACEYYLV